MNRFTISIPEVSFANRRTRIIAISVVSALAIILVVGLAVYFVVVRQVSRPGEATAYLMPSDALVYASVNLRPGINQIRHASDFFSLLESSELQDRIDEVLDEAEDDSRIHFLDDVTPWLGTDITFALLDLDSDDWGDPVPEWVGLVQVSDRDEAADFLDDLLDYLEDELYTEFDDDTYRGADIFFAIDEDVALGLTDDYLIIGDSEDSVADIVRNLEEPPSRPLSDNPGFMAARDALPGDRTMFLYFQVEDIVDPFLDLGGIGDSALLPEDLPEYIAASSSFVENGLRVDIVSDTTGDMTMFSGENQLKSRDFMPEDTLVLLSTVGAREIWEQTRESIEEVNPYSGEDIDDLLRAFEREVGVDIERDIIEPLSGGTGSGHADFRSETRQILEYRARDHRRPGVR